MTQPADGEDEPEESWENLAGLEMEDSGESSDKAEAGRGRKENGGECDASRELMIRMRNSPLARKLKVGTSLNPSPTVLGSSPNVGSLTLSI